MLLPGRTNRAVKNLFVGNLKWGARLPEIQNRYLENKTPLEDLLEVTPDYPGGPPKERPGLLMGGVQRFGLGGTASPSSLVAASTSSAGSAWASDMTEQALLHGGMGGGLHGMHQFGVRRPHDAIESGSPTNGMHSPKVRLGFCPGGDLGVLDDAATALHLSSLSLTYRLISAPP